jgi:uncharacterized protein (TIGR02186 family)
MKGRVWLLACVLLWPTSLHAGDVVADLSAASVSVNTGFTGTKLTVFGVLDAHNDAVVALEGPDATLSVSRKIKHFGFWVTGDAVTIEHVPKFFALASTRPLATIGSATDLKDHGLMLKPDPEAAETDPTNAFHDALIGIMRQQGLYDFTGGKISVKGGRLFRADFDLPINVPIGIYRVHIAAFHDGAFVAARILPLTIDESGAAALVQSASSIHPFIYAFFSLLAVLALGAGSTLFAVVRKGKQ